MYLELLGLLDYEEFYCHETGSSNRTSNIMGAFTTSLSVYDQLFHVGVPVWPVHPYSALHSFVWLYYYVLYLFLIYNIAYLLI
jgi:hypothetical protein